MPYLNLLEPAALLRHLAAFPPDGFTCQPVASAAPAAVIAKPPAGVTLAPCTPAFVAPFDLLTTAEPALLQRLQALPWFTHLRGLLRWRTAFIGSPVTEYLPLSPDADIDTLPAAWRQAFGGRHRLLIAKDIPQQSPLLSAAENAAAERLAQACADDGWLLLQGQALAYVRIDFADVDTYLARLSASRRKNLRRKWKSLAALHVEQRPTGDAAYADDAHVDACHALYLQVHAQSQVRFDLLSRAFLAALLRDGDCAGIVFEYRLRDAPGRPLIGWNLCYQHGGNLVDKYIGLSYPLARQHDLYFVTWLQNLGHACDRGLANYVAGWTDPQVKAQLGASFTFTRHAVHVRNPVLRALARRLLRHFESDAAVLAARP